MGFLVFIAIIVCSIHGEIQITPKGHLESITGCPKWDDFETFYKDMDPCPENYNIDRIDPNKNYCPENCRWTDYYTQPKIEGILIEFSPIKEKLKSSRNGSEF